MSEELESKIDDGGDKDYAVKTSRKNVGGKVNPENLLRTDEWLKIFKAVFIVGDSWDMINLSMISSTNTWLEILDILSRSPEMSEWKLDLVMPLLLKYFDMPDVLAIRGTCQRLNKTVDKVLDAGDRIHLGLKDQGHFSQLIPPSFLKRRGSFEKLHFLPMAGRSIYLQSTACIDRFRGFLEDARERFPWRNPIIRAKVDVTILNRSDDDEEVYIPYNDNHLSISLEDYFANMWQVDIQRKQISNRVVDRMLGLLEIGAEYIDYVHFTDIASGISSDTEKYRLIERMLQALPKVCSLSVLFNTSNFLDEENIQVLEEYIDNGHHLPECPSLLRLAFTNYRWSECLFREIADRYCTHIKYLKLTIQDDPSYWRETKVDGNGVHRESFEFPVLETLHVLDFAWRCHPVLLRIAAPRLELLDLNLILLKEQNPKTTSIIELANVITNFEGLTKLCLDLPINFDTSKSDADTAATFAKRNLKVADLTLKNTMKVPLRFFTQLCPNLEGLKIIVYMHHTPIIMHMHGMEPPRNSFCAMARKYERRAKKSLLWKDALKLNKIILVDWVVGNLNHSEYTIMRPVPEMHIELVD